MRPNFAPQWYILNFLFKCNASNAVQCVSPNLLLALNPRLLYSHSLPIPVYDGPASVSVRAAGGAFSVDVALLLVTSS